MSNTLVQEIRLRSPEPFPRRETSLARLFQRVILTQGFRRLQKETAAPLDGGLRRLLSRSSEGIKVLW